MNDIRPIRTEEDYSWALAEVEQYFDQEPEPGTPESDRFEVLTTLIEAYEEKHWPIEAPDPVDMIRYAIEEMGHSQTELAELLGSRSRASEILNRKRPLTMKAAYKLHTLWHLPAAALIRPYHLESD
jgi:HTH-type transcriptional regulator/antitoxin HigA